MVKMPDRVRLAGSEPSDIPWFKVFAGLLIVLLTLLVLVEQAEIKSLQEQLMVIEGHLLIK